MTGMHRPRVSIYEWVSILPASTLHGGNRKTVRKFNIRIQTKFSQFNIRMGIFIDEKRKTVNIILRSG